MRFAVALNDLIDVNVMTAFADADGYAAPVSCHLHMETFR